MQLADDTAQRGPHSRIRWLGFAGFLGGNPLGDTAGGSDKEVAGATGGVADGKVEQRRDPFLNRPVRGYLIEQRIERGVEEAFDQGGRRVVGTGLFALVPGSASRV